MKTRLVITLCGLLWGNITFADTLPSSQQFTPYHAHQWQTADTAHFSGSARFSRLPSVPNSTEAVGIVEFDAGSITDWYSHSHGQYLIVTEGEGRTQEWGKPIQIIKKGDVIWCPPNVKHWHGATPHSKMSHIVISPNAQNNKATWFEKVALPSFNRDDALQKISQNQPLDHRQLALIPITFWSAKGDLDQLKSTLQQGLDKGLTVSELQETFVHQYAYAGFPRALNGLLTLQNLLKERSEKGINDLQGESVAISDHLDFYQVGVQTINVLNERDNSGILWNTPSVDYALKAHLFGYLFSRDNLSAVNHELVTVATLISLESVPNQLRSHLMILKNLGIDKPEQQRITQNIAQYSPSSAQKTDDVLNAVF